MKPIDSNTTFTLLSKYRMELMVFSALLIILYHLHVWQLVPEYTKYILRFTSGGVDMFLFLSGIGLCYSIEKNSSISNFYSKRFIRIYPSFAIVTAIGLFIGEKTIASMILLFTGMTYWFAPFMNVDEGFWYVSLIILLYILFPHLYRILKHTTINHCIYMLVVVFALPYIVHFLWGNYYDYGLTRITPFLLGAFLYVKRRKWKVYMSNLLIYSSLVIFVTLNTYSLLSEGGNIDKTMIQLSLQGIIAPGFCLIFVLVLSHCSTVILCCLHWLGTMSLELYMVHLTLYYWIKSPLLLLGISITVSYIIHFISGLILKCLHSFRD